MAIGLGIGIGITIAGAGQAGEAIPRIQLSGLSIAENAAGEAEIGTASVANGSGTYAFSITSDPDSKFSIVEATGVLSLGAEATLDYETATSHQVTIQADNGVDDPISRTFTVTVTNVIEAPVNVTPPAVTGSVEVGSTLSCSTGTWTDMQAGSYAYQWKDASDDSSIEGATASTLALTHALIDVELYCAVTATNSADSTAEDSNTVGPVVDTTAPVLSSASASGTGYTSGSAGVSTNEGNGTLYVVVTTSATKPSAAQIKAGDDHADADATLADNAAVSAAGAQDAFTITGLTHTTTYYAHFMHEDAEGNQSAVSTASFQTTAAAVPGAFEVGDWSIAAGDEEADVTVSSLPASNGASITDIEYRIGSGSAVSSGTSDTTGFTIGSLTNDIEVNVQLRAVNSVGAGAWSDVKAVTPEAEGGEETFEEAVIALLGAKLNAWWDFDNSDYLWTDTGGTTPAGISDAVARADDKINGHAALQATGANRPVLSASRGCLFDGVNDLLVAADHADLRPTAQITVYCWIYPTTNGPIFFKEGSTLGYGTWNTNPRLYIRINGAWRDSGSNLSPTLNQWQSIALTHDGSATKGWIDHVAVWTPTPAAGAIQQGTTDFQIGRNATQGFSGRLGGIIICNEALSETELADLDTLFAAEYAS